MQKLIICLEGLKFKQQENKEKVNIDEKGCFTCQAKPQTQEPPELPILRIQDGSDSCLGLRFIIASALR